PRTSADRAPASRPPPSRPPPRPPRGRRCLAGQNPHQKRPPRRRRVAQPLHRLPAAAAAHKPVGVQGRLAGPLWLNVDLCRALALGPGADVLGPFLRPGHLIDRQLAERDAVELLTRHTSSVIPGKTEYGPS